MRDGKGVRVNLCLQRLGKLKIWMERSPGSNKDKIKRNDTSYAAILQQKKGRNSHSFERRMKKSFLRKAIEGTGIHSVTNGVRKVLREGEICKSEF